MKNAINILAIISALVAGINAVDGITIPYAVQIIQVIAVIQGVISTYLLGQKVVRNRGENRENISIRLVKEFYRVREGTILAVLVNSQIPDDCREQDNR